VAATDFVRKYLSVARDLLDAIGGDAALAGGLAVSAHGYVRATNDVDIATSVPLPEVARRLKARRIVGSLRKGDRLEGDMPCVTGFVGDIPFDILPDRVAIGAMEIEVGGQRLRVIDADTLIRMKLLAGSVRDLDDLAILALIDAGFRRRAEALAAADADRGPRLVAMLTDPRTRARARAVLRQSRRRARNQDR
jgi:hypothetical protein